MSGIFISYRREDSQDLAGRLYDRLAQRFGKERVFRDVDAIDPGVNFTEMVHERIGGCDALVALIGKGWVEARDAEGRRRLDLPRDLVKAEIAAALAQGKLVIPVLIEGTSTPSTADSGHAPSRKADRAPAFLLSGLLRTPSGDRWYGNRTAKTEFYRVKTPAGSRNMAVAQVDSIVVDTVANDLASSAWAAEALKATKAMFAVSHAEEIAAAKAQITALEGRAARMVDMAAGLESPAPVLRRIDEIERERVAVEQRVVAWEHEDEASRSFADVTEAQVRRCLRGMADEMRTYPRGEMRDFLTSILSEVELDPVESTVRLNYRIPLSGNSVASPGGLGAIPTLIFKSLARVA